MTNYYDFGFMVCYSLFNACLIYFVTHLNIYRFRELLQLRVFMVLGFILSAAMLVGDIIENQQLLELTKAPDADGIVLGTLSSLIYWTRIKWGAIFVVALMLCSGYTAYFRRVPTLLLPAIYAVAGIAGLVAISVPMARPMLETIGAPAIALAWASSLIHATVFLIRRHDEFPLPTNHRNRQTSPVEARA